MDGWGWWFLWCYSLGPGSAELFFLQGWQQSGGGGRGGVWVLPPGDEGAGEVWARPQSEDVRGHCERGRRGGGRGALPGALLWLERQVRQDLGRNHLNVYFHPNSKENRPKNKFLKIHLLTHGITAYVGVPAAVTLPHNSASCEPVPWSALWLWRALGHLVAETQLSIGLMRIHSSASSLSVLTKIPCLSVPQLSVSQTDLQTAWFFLFIFLFLTNLKSFNNQTKLPILQCDIWMWANTEWPT